MAPSAVNDNSVGLEVGSSMLHRSLHDKPLRVVKAKGNWLHLEDGRVLFDSTGGAAVACLGHGDERVAAAVARQMADFSYIHSLLYTSSAAEELAKLLVDSTHGHMTKAFIVSSGSEACEAAMKLARQYFLELPVPQPKRVNYIARKESYHGNTLGALSMSGHKLRRALFEPVLMPSITHVSACNAYREQLEGESTEDYASRLAQELDDEFNRLGADTVIAFMAEPVVGAALGCVPAVEGYLKAMRTVCDKHGALLILDEVMSGMGRTGRLHAWEEDNVIPDIQTIGKGLGGGFAPVAGILINKRVVKVLDQGTGAFSHGQTYQGHPVSCAAALEVQKIIQKENLLENVQKMGSLLSSLLKEKLASHPNVGDIRGRGLFWGLEFVQDKATKEPFEPSVGVAIGVHEMGLRHGIHLYPGTGTVDGRRGDHVLLGPAYNISEDDIRYVAKTTADAVTEYFNVLLRRSM